MSWALVLTAVTLLAAVTAPDTALAAVLLATTRLVWRTLSGDRALRGGQGFAFGTVALLGLWLLFAAAQIGGGISHL